MRKFIVWCQSRSLWLWAGVIIVSMLLSLGLQYRSLTALEFFTSAAHRGTLRKYLSAVATEAAHFYRANAERSLHLTTRDDGRPASRQPTFKQAEGAQLFFIARMQKSAPPALRFYRPTGEAFASAPAASVVHAVRTALAPWQYLHAQDLVLDPINLSADERDPAHRMILKPLTDNASRITGVIGMMIDTAFFQHQYLPNLMQDLLPQFCTETARQNAIVAVLDAPGRLLYASDALPDSEPEVSLPLQFLFTDWRIGIWNRYVTPEQWSRYHFAFNVALSISLTIALIAGVIFALRMAARSMRLARMQTDFVSNVSHELRTPLAAIRAAAELLRLGRLGEGEKVREYGRYIETESLRLTRLINNILDFAKMEAQQKIYRAEPLDLEDVVAQALQILAVRLEQGGYDVQVSGPEAPLPEIPGDVDAVTQALLNVLDNAMKYAADAPAIHIRLGQQSGYNTIAVSDSGMGIPRAEHARIFERFYRVSTGEVHNVKGSGLGLAIVRHIMEAHQGHITLESDTGQGCTLTLHFPVADSAPEISPDELFNAPVHERENV